MDHIKLIVCQAYSINLYRNIRMKIMKCCANIYFNPLNAELNSICHLLALLEAHHILHVSWIRVNQQCLFRKVIPNYAKFKVPYTSPASQYCVY